MKSALSIVALSLMMSPPSFGTTTTFSGNVSSNWQDASNWSSGVPSSIDEAIISPVSNNPNLTAISYAKSIATAPSSLGTIVFTAATTTYTLNLYPLGGAAITLNDNSSFENFQTIFHSSGTIILGPSTSNFLNNLSKIRFANADLSLEITGPGDFFLQGDIAAESSGPLFNLGTLTLSGASITLQSPADLGRAAKNFYMTAGTLFNQSACANSCDNAQITAGSITNSGAFLQSCGTLAFSGDYLINSGFMAGSATKASFQNGTVFNSNELAWGASLVELAGAEVINNAGQIGLLAANFAISGGSITINNGEVARQTTVITDISGGSITIKPAGILGNLDAYLLIRGASTSIFNEGLIGPNVQTFRMLNGTLYNTANSYVATNATLVQLQGQSCLIQDGSSNFAQGASLLEVSSPNVNITNGTSCNFGKNSSYNITSGSMTNYGTIGYQVVSGTFSGGYVSNYGDFALNGSSVYLTGGTISVFGSATIANNATFVQINGLNVITLKDFSIAQGAITKNIISYNLINNGTIASNQTSATFTNTTTNNGTAGQNCGTITITNATINNGTSGNFGNNSTITDITNTSITNSGSFSNQNATITINNSTITNGSIGNFGNNSTSTQISGSTSIDNDGICFGSVSDLIITSGSITNGTSGNFGNDVNSATITSGASITNTGTIFDHAGTLTISTTDIMNGTAGNIGSDATTSILNGNLIICYGDGFNRNNSLTITAGTIDVGSAGNFGNNGTSVDLTGGANITSNGSCFDSVSDLIISSASITNGTSGNFGNDVNSATITSGASITNTGTIFDHAGTLTISTTDIINGTSGNIGSDATTSILSGNLIICYGDGFNRNNSLTITAGTIDVGSAGNFGNNGTSVDLTGGANVTNSGTCFDSVTNVSIAGGDIFNDSSGNFGSSAITATITSGASITNDGTFFDGAGSLSVSGGTILNGTSGGFADNAGKTNLSGGILVICYGDGFNRNNSLTITAGTIDVGSAGNFGNNGTSVELAVNSVITNKGIMFDHVVDLSITSASITNEATGNFAPHVLSATISSDAKIFNSGTCFADNAKLVFLGGSISNAGLIGKNATVSVTSGTFINALLGELFTNSKSCTISGGYFENSFKIGQGASYFKINGGVFNLLNGSELATNASDFILEDIDFVVGTGASVARGATCSIINSTVTNNESLGTESPNLKLISGTVTNYNYIGLNATSYVNGGYIQNTSPLGFLFPGPLSYVSITGGVIDNYSNCGSEALYFSLDGATLNTYPSSVLAYKVGQLIIKNTNFINATSASLGENATASFINAHITNYGEACQASPHIQIISGKIDNFNSFGSASQAFMSGGSLFNKMGGTCFHYANVFISSGVFENSGDMLKSATLTLTDPGVIDNKTGGTLGYNFFASIQGGGLRNDGNLGPCEINQSGGFLQNNSTLTLGKLDPSFSNFLSSTSTFAAGNVQGTGQVNVAAHTVISNNFTQNKIIVGWGAINPPLFQNVYGTLYADGNINSDVIVTGSGSLFGIGLIQGDVEVKKSGIFSPGNYLDPVSNLKIKGDVTLEPESLTTMEFDLSGSDKITVYNGNLNIDGAYLYMTALQKPLPEITYTLAEIVKLGDLGSTGGTIYGQFIVQGEQPLIEYTLHYEPQAILYEGKCLPCRGVAKLPNEYAVASLIDKLDGNTNACLQGEIDQIFLMTNSQITSVLNTLQPSEMKAQQIALEELTFVLNDEFLDQLKYNPYPSSINLAAGYLNMNQNSYFQYSGFKTNSGYELVSFNHSFKNTSIGLGFASMQTDTSFKKLASHTKSLSFVGMFSVLQKANHLEAYVDLLYGYHYLNNSRHINVFNYEAKTKHGGFSTKAELGLGYVNEKKESVFKIYDNVMYYFGHENAYKETGAFCLGLHVYSSNRSVIRNELGSSIKLGKKLMQPYVDLAYVYENRLSGSTYKANFINTKPTMTVTGNPMTHNFLRAMMGVSGAHKIIKYNLKLQTQVGKRYTQAACELDLNFGF